MSGKDVKIEFRGRVYSVEKILRLYQSGTGAPFTEHEEGALNFLYEWYFGQGPIEVLTSGSTGKPKKIRFDRSQFIASAKQTQYYLQYKAGERALLCLPAKFIAGKLMIVRSLESKMLLTLGESSALPLEKVEGEIDFCAMTPMQVENSLNKQADLRLPKKLIIGGAAISEQLLQKLQSRKETIVESYGMTETLTHIAFRPIAPKLSKNFIPFRNVELRLDERNCLCIKTPYLKNEVITNDIAKIFPDGNFIILGRVDHVINSGGVKIFPERIEQKLKDLIPSPFIIGAIPDTKYGEIAVLVIEKSERIQLSSNEILSKAKSIPTCKFLKKIFFVEKLAYTPTGKIIRGESIKRIL